ncbi:MAG: kdsB [Hydrocarboniphaga sp.]|uniref:3-deoxy-manno-octulosonate cytidylyltransferase n=1 Tax=Hydrocarboniphaga sp. TaxID=2033016 RepID=UPI0026128429|nr:3-deoxy-manno-octulosonate cytidylyltransferase [Hydrocarboniphaga sp.]MDB5967697.1 kdsB [Hydrocarboniphaga sp.]
MNDAMMPSLKFKVVIPARLGSTRLPGKVLRELHGRPVIAHVWDAARASGAEQVLIATDDEKVAVAARGFGAEVRMTSSSHNSGTDRVNEVARIEGWADEVIVVNLQGDEPLMPPALLRQAAALLADDPIADLATLAHPLHSVEEFLNPNVVKVVADRRHYALYFSRAPIPWKRDGATRDKPLLPEGLAYRHIGLYAYRSGRLAEFSALPPAPLEDCEALEQLRALANGLRIKLGFTDNPPPRGVDTEEDLAFVSAALSRR